MPHQLFEAEFGEMVTETEAEGCPTPGSDPTDIVVVLDCANIGWMYGQDIFCARGVQLAFDYFSPHHGVTCIGFLPAAFLKKRPKHGSGSGHNSVMQTDDWDILDNLRRARKIEIVPAGDNDDLYILTYARQQQERGFVVSNDFFADHIQRLANQTVQRNTRDWVRGHRCSFTFVRDAFVLNPER